MENKDIEHLRLLSIFHYILGGIMALFSCFPLIHIAMGIAIIMGKFIDDNSGQAPPPFVGWMVIIMGSVFILSGWIMSVFVLIAGMKLKRKTNRVFCMVIAGIECLFMPFGTVLGVFAIIVLCRESTKELFDQKLSESTHLQPES